MGVAVVRPSMVHGNIAVDLKPAPINPAWILDGTPMARNAELSRSRDGTACTLIWDCTPGRFEWRYQTEETIHILEGSVILDDGIEPAHRLGPGDIVFFPAGAVVRWEVETHVRKLAFFRRQLPKPLEIVVRGMRTAKKAIRSSQPKPAVGWMGEPAAVPARAAMETAGVP